MNANDLASLSLKEMKALALRLGNTRMEAIRMVINHVPRIIQLKLESENPTGSVKDRTASGLIQALEERGALRPGACVIESTSGNLGVALAFLCKIKGYSFMAVVDPKTTPENMTRMKALGAQIVLVQQPDQFGGYLLSRLEYIREQCRRSPHYVWPNQYANIANPGIHMENTGPEIYRQMHGKVDALFAAVSTGGTLAGISQYFRLASPKTRIIAVDAYGSVVFGSTPGPRKLTGIGASQPPKFIRREHYDDYVLVSDQEAFSTCRTLKSALDLSIGGSSGAVLFACIRYLAAHPELRDIVCLCPDGGENYATSIFNDAWLFENHITVSGTLLGLVQSIEPATVYA